jgi:hypothetical protein
MLARQLQTHWSLLQFHSGNLKLHRIRDKTPVGCHLQAIKTQGRIDEIAGSIE